MTEPYPYPELPPYQPPYYVRFSFVLKTTPQILDPDYESNRAKNLVERMLGRDNVFDWEIVEVLPHDYEEVNP